MRARCPLARATAAARVPTSAACAAAAGTRADGGPRELGPGARQAMAAWIEELEREEHARKGAQAELIRRKKEKHAKKG